jgi:hypothetical protein
MENLRDSELGPEEEKKMAHDDINPYVIKQDDFFYKIKELNP